uniref:Uncharacterized protein n=1 Tax=Panagrolaimus davidi TaxID=227884 RepID=A0A914PYP8_9BILA
MEDAFWTTPAMVNYGMTAMPMEIRFETLMGSFFQGNGNNHDAETRYRLWITSYNQPALLFSSIVTSIQDPIRNYGGKFPTLLKTLIDDSRIGNAQIDLVNEGPKFASLVMRRISNHSSIAGDSKRAMPWFGCRLEIADDARVREHLTTMVLSLRRERDEERRKREQLEVELECYKTKPHLNNDEEEEDENERFQDLLNTIASVPTTSSPSGHLLSNPPSNDKISDEIIDEEQLIPTDFADILSSSDSTTYHRVITPLIRTSSQQPSSSSSAPTNSSRILIPPKLTPPLLPSSSGSSNSSNLRSTENILRAR